MNQLDWEKLHTAQSMLEDCLAAADVTELRRIDNILDDLKSSVEDNVLALAGIGGDY